jgi:hypothetical protein
MTLIVRPGFQFDTDASTYIEAVEVADAQALETATRYAINDFVIGCKQDGIWSAIKASCILSGARTLAGALIPLAGTAPTNLGPFVSGDYNRKTGLVGNGISKALNSNRSRSADPINSFHASLFLSTAGTSVLFGAATNNQNDQVLALNATQGTFVRGRTVSIDNRVTGFIGASNNVSALTARASGRNVVNTDSMYSSFADSSNYYIFARNISDGSPTAGSPTGARLAFYSIGESLNLAALDARVTALITAFGVAIP